MKGKILDFNQETKMGVISSEDGKRYNFTADDFKSSQSIATSMEVDFIEDAENAKEIYLSSVTQASVSLGKPPKTSTAAIVSIIFGILGLFLFGSLVGIISGHIARSNIKKSNGQLGGDGLALTGLITGYIGFALWILVMIAVAIPKLANLQHDIAKTKEMNSIQRPY